MATMSLTATAQMCNRRDEVRVWRAEDIEQRVLNNAFMLWERYAESNRRFVEERAEQLKSFANLAALIAGFAIVAFLQVCSRPDTFLDLLPIMH